jgi:hypothetical protein
MQPLLLLYSAAFSSSVAAAPELDSFARLLEFWKYSNKEWLRQRLAL